MERPSTVQIVCKLANAGEHVGFTLQQMIDLLNAGLTVETLLYLIEWRLHHPVDPPSGSSRWVM